jgi:hypothetical protein
MNEEEQFWELVSPLTDLFDLGSDISEVFDYKEISEEKVDEIRDQMFLAELPISGDAAINLVRTAMHAIVEGCETCKENLIQFSFQATMAIWSTIARDTGIFEDE